MQPSSISRMEGTAVDPHHDRRIVHPFGQVQIQQKWPIPTDDRIRDLLVHPHAEQDRAALTSLMVGLMLPCQRSVCINRSFCNGSEPGLS